MVYVHQQVTEVIGRWLMADIHDVCVLLAGSCVPLVIRINYFYQLIKLITKTLVKGGERLWFRLNIKKIIMSCIVSHPKLTQVLRVA